MRIPAIAAALVAGLAAGAAAAQDDEGVTVVFALDVAEDSSQAAAVNSIQPILDYVRQQPGLIDEQLLRGATDTSQDYVSVMRWERLEDFEAMFADQAFLDTLSSVDPKFEQSAAEVYLPVQ